MAHRAPIRYAIFAAVTAFVVLASVRNQACTGIRLKAADGSFVYGRTMEFGTEVVSFDLLFVPRNQSFAGQSDFAKPVMSWKTQYAYVGFNPFGRPLVVDGLNEKGLACGGLIFSGYARYESVTEADYEKTISCLDLVSWILGTCAKVSEVRERLPRLHVCGALLAEWGVVPPLHYVVHDQTGDSLVIEYTDGKLHLFDCPLGVITNAPTYDWQMTNLRNYIGLKAINDPSVTVNGFQLSQLGQGSGATGLPGDFTPSSRFVRAAFLANAVFQPKGAEEAVLTAFHILNQFDIPPGAIRDVQGGRVIADTTQWTSAADMRNLRYFFHTYHDRAVRVVDLGRMDLNSPSTQSMKNVQQPGKIQDVSGELR